MDSRGRRWGGKEFCRRPCERGDRMAVKVVFFRVEGDCGERVFEASVEGLEGSAYVEVGRGAARVWGCTADV